MAKQKKKEQPKPPRTSLRWQTREQYERAKSAAGTIPLATFVLDRFMRSLDKSNAA